MNIRTSLSAALAGVAAAALAAGVAPSTATATSVVVPTATPGVAPSYQPPPIEWGPCRDSYLEGRAECGTLVVPRDYARPQGKKLRLAVSRAEHTSEDYQGVMLTNPGGPGGYGTWMAVLGEFVPDGVGAQYDWVGMDPRGVDSPENDEPALSCTSRYLEGDRPPYRPTTEAIYDAWIKRSVGYARACARSESAPLLEHMGTTDIVQDFESLRKALAAPRVSFYGYSYGTYIGQVYASTYPNKVRRMVLDGVIGPGRVWYRHNQDQDRGFERAGQVYFRWVARHDDTYGLGSTRAEVEKGYYRLQRRLDRRAADGLLGGSEFADVLLGATYYVYGWTDIAEAWAALANDGDAGPMIALAGVSEETPPPGADNGILGYLATTCTDAPWPDTQAETDEDNWRIDRNFPFQTWANAWFNGPCNYWPVADRERIEVSDPVGQDMLLVNETLDAATPFPGALEARDVFRNARLIEGEGGTTHSGSLNGVACTDDTIARYLRDGTLPKRRSGRRADKVCPPVPQPEPAAGEGRADGVRGGLPSELRDLLVHAQRPGLVR